MSVVAAAGLAVLAGWLLLARPVARSGRTPSLAWAGLSRAWLVGAALAALAGATMLLDGRWLVLTLVVAGAVAGTLRLVRSRRLAAARDRAAGEVVDFCEAVAAELAAGAPPLHALAEAVADFPALGPAATAARLGADVPDALRSLARRPGCHDLDVVAAAWQVAHRSGGGLAEPLARAAALVRDRRRTAQVVAAELAPARATAQLMAALPVVFLVAGSGLGGDPIAFLTATSAGVGCLAAGLLLSFAGLVWLQRIAVRVEAPP